jgi:hypothetical protein
MKFSMERFRITAHPETAQDQAYLEETFGLKLDGYNEYVVMSVRCQAVDVEKVKEAGSYEPRTYECQLRFGHAGKHRCDNIYTGKNHEWGEEKDQPETLQHAYDKLASDGKLTPAQEAAFIERVADSASLLKDVTLKCFLCGQVLTEEPGPQGRILGHADSCANLERDMLPREERERRWLAEHPPEVLE